MSAFDAPKLSGTTDVQMDHSSPDDLPAMHKTACLQCRHQKIKCKPSPNGSIVCARCQKMGLSCVYQGRRERTSKATRERDGQEPPLKRRLVAQDSSSTSQNVSAQPGPFAPVLKSPITNTSFSDASPSSSANHPSPASSHHDKKTCTIWAQAREGVCRSHTHPRHLEKVHVDPSVIEELFTTFFLSYAADVPILDPLLSPNDYYARSPLLFWSIMSVASRRYAADPTLLPSLSAATFKLAIQQVDGPAADIHTVESLLLLLSWQFPTNSIHEEAGYVLSGAMIHLAFKFGLHTAEAGQDYVRVRLNLDEAEIKRRRVLWAACVIVYQEVSTMLGNTYLQIPTPLITKEIPRLGCSDPRLRLQLQSILARANNAFGDNGTDINTPSEERTWKLLIRTYDDEIKIAESGYEVLSDREKLFITYAHMQIQVMHFFRPSQTIEGCVIAKIYSTTVRLIELVAALDKEMQYAHFLTAYIMRSMALAGCILLRLIKTPFGDAINVEEAKTFFLTGLQLIQKMTVANNDGPARCSTALSRLWRSDRVFKKPDGTPHLALRVRSRYGPSILWDAMAWCREEFGTQFNTTTKPLPSEPQPEVPTTSKQEQIVPMQTNFMPPPAEPIAGIEKIPLSFDWSMDDWFFSPDMSLAGEWSVPTDMMGGYSLGL